MAQPSVPRPSPDAAALVRLEVRAGKGPPAVYEVGDGGFLLGSVPGCDLRLPGANLAPVICLISRLPAGAGLRKLAPVQPIAVNGRNVTSAYLHDGDRITLGPIEIAVGITLPPAPPAPAPTVTIPPDLEARLRAFAERERALAEQAQELETDRVIWYRRREGMEAECQRLKDSVEELSRRARQQERDLSATRTELEARELAWREGQVELDRQRQAVEGRATELTRQQDELNGVRRELVQIRQQLAQRYQHRRDRLLARQEALRKAAKRLRARQQEAERQGAELAARQEEWALRQEEIAARGEQVEREKQLLEEQHGLLGSRQQELQRDLAERLNDVQTRERVLAEERVALEKGQKQHQADLVRLDRIQAGIEQRQKQLEARALEVDRGFEQLQRESRDLEEQAKQLDDSHTRLAGETERLGAQKKEQEAQTAELERRAAALEGQQAMLTTLRTRLERMREELRRQEQVLSDQRALQEASEADLKERIAEGQRLRTDLDNDKQLMGEERRRFGEQRATLEEAVSRLRAAQESIAAEHEQLQQAQQQVEATAAEQAEQAGLLLARGTQLEEMQARLAADRQAHKEREATLTRSEQALGQLQEQVRRRSDDLAERQRQAAERERQLQEAAARLEAQRQATEAEHKLAAERLEELLHDLDRRAGEQEQRGKELDARELMLRGEQERVEDAQGSLTSQRQALAGERIAWEVEKQAAAESARAEREAAESARAEARALAAALPDLEGRAKSALERVARAREQLREHLAELHAYARQAREDLDGARRHVQAEAERVRQQDLALQVARDEHRLAVAAFRQQHIDWQAQVGEIKQLLQQGETQLDRRRAEVDQQAQALADTSAKLAEQAEELGRQQRRTSERRAEVDRHLADMQDWYRKKLRELAGLDGTAAEAKGLATVVPLGREEGAAVLALADEVEPADRQLGELLRSLELIDADTLQALLLEARRQRRSLRQLLLAGGYLTLYQIALIEAGNLAGLVLGPVRVIDRLQATGHEVVYRVFDPRRNAEALLRHLSEAVMEDAVRPDEFRQRFAAATEVRDAHVAAVLEVLDIAGRPAALSEWVSGAPSSDWPAQASAPGAWLRLVQQSAWALHSTHAAGLCHGHLEPSSFVLTAEGALKLCGLGEPRWLLGLPDGIESAADDLVAFGQIAADWSALAPAGKGPKAKPLPAEVQAVVARLREPGGYSSATALLEHLERASAALPVGTAAWERLLSQVRSPSGAAGQRRSA
jgi:chromosome segregation ATPase